MQITLHIANVQTLIVGGGNDCFSSPAPSASSLPRRSVETPVAAAYVPAPMQMLRAAIQRPCPTCGGSRQITRNTPDFPGEFEFAVCPTCRERRPE